MKSSIRSVSAWAWPGAGRFHPVLAATLLLVVQQAGAWPDLRINKTGPAQAAPGDVITYTLSYSNVGPVKSTVVVMKDFLPTNVTALTNTLNGGSLSGGTITWNLGTLNSKANGSRTFQVRINTNATVAVTNQAQIFGKEAEEKGKTKDNYSTLITTLVNVNQPPVARDDDYTIGEDTPLLITVPGVLANDTDPNGNALTAILLSSVTHGTLLLHANGSFSYTPDSNYNGTDSFTYRANDGQTNSGIATVTITVLPVNDPPVARDDQYSTSEDIALTVLPPGVLLNDSDPDGDALAAVIVTQPGNGQVILNSNGSFTYSPATNFNGTDTFTYRANDGVTNSGVATVTIIVSPVNDPPVARDDAFSVNENTALTVPAPGVLVNDSDGDGDVLTAILTTGPTNGLVSLDSNGGFVYTPNSNYHGADAFAYRARDGAADSGIAIVSITVIPANHPPVALNDEYSTPEDSVLTIAAPGVLGNDSDPDGDSLAAIITSQPGYGQLSFSTNGGFIYTPSPDFSGVDSFTYRANDGVTNSGNATVTITVSPVNDPPVAQSDSYSVNEGSTLVQASPGVLGNDSDPDGDPLTAVLVNGPTNGVLMLNSDGSFNYTPNTNYTGPDSFSYRANDGNADSGIALVSIDVLPVNHPPVAQDDDYSTGEDTALIVAAPGVLANDSDPDGDALQAIIVNAPTNGLLTLNPDGGFAYMPFTNFSGVDAFTYRASDGITNSQVATVTITVIGTNDAPIARDDQYSTAEDMVLVVSAPGVLVNDSDPDDDVLAANIVTLPANGLVTLNLDGSFGYTPNTNFNGIDTFTYRANDGIATSAVATVTITVVGTNDPPLAQDDQYTTFRDMALNIPAPGVLANDSDPENDPLTVVIANPATNGLVNLNSNGGFTYTPNADFTGVDTFTYRASDGQANSGIATVSISILPLNRPPVAQDDVYTVGEDTLLLITGPGVLSNDSDLDNDTLTALLLSNPTNGLLSLNPDGGFSYQPDTNFNGLDSFTYRASDGITNSQPATVTITVTAVNDPPIARDDQYTMDEETVLVVTAPGVLLNDSDPEGDSITASVATLPANGLLTFNNDGSFTYTPNSNFFGMDSFTYRANDGQLDSAPATVSIQVTDVYDPPNTNNWSGKSFTTYEDTVLNVAPPGVLAGIIGFDASALKAALVRRITNGTLNLELDGSFSLRPLTNFNGVDAFEFAVVNGSSNYPTLKVDITVIPVNDPPVFVKGGNFHLPLNAGPQVSPGWATGISPGPADESGQAVTFEISNDNGSLFSVQPVLAANGTLTFTPATGVSGKATVTILARDNGGTADGGIDASLPENFSITVNAPPTVQIVNPTNGASYFAPGSFTVLADAQDTDGTVVLVEFFSGTNKVAEATTEPFFTVLTNLSAGTYTLGAVATDDFGATGSATPITVNVITQPPLIALTSVYYNPQRDIFEQRVRVTNPTYSMVNAVRVLVQNLTNVPPITVGNRSGITNGLPYVQSSGVVQPGGYVDLTIEYLSPKRIMPNPVLRAELVPPAGPVPPLSGSFQHINRGLLLANRTFLVEFNTLSNRVYAIQYSKDLSDWKTSLPAVAGDGSWIQWIDNGEPRTESPPAAAPARFYRLLLLP